MPDTFAPEPPRLFGEVPKKPDLMDTVTYFLRPHIVTPEAHRIGQAIARKQAKAALDMAKPAD